MSGLSTKLRILITTNTKYKNVIVIAKNKEGANRYDTGVSDGKITRKRNNDKKDNP